MPEFIIRLTGPPQVEHNGQPLRGFESDKALALLAYVILQGRALSRETLTGLFWGELPQERAQGNLRRVLHNLTHLLPGCLEVERRSVRFCAAGPCLVDVLHFAALAAYDALPSLEEAALWLGGPLLEGLTLRDCPDFELWLAGERERWLHAALRVLETLAESHARRGDPARALTYVERLLILAPWREKSHRRKMLLLARLGQRSAALKQYTQCRAILETELGVTPAAETERLAERLRRQAAPLAAAESPALPPLVGRQAELAELSYQLTDPACRLLTLVGPGGVGKTRLAWEIVARLAHTFMDGTALIPLEDVSQPEALPGAVLLALGTPLAGETPPAVALRQLLRNREALLVLDNFEQLVEHAAVLSQWLREAPALKLLVTSRERLRLRDEWVFNVDGLSLTRAGDAVALFRQRARQVGGLRAATPETLETIAQLCSLLAGLPLGIELAAALSAELPPEALLQRLQTTFDALESPLRDLPARHRSLRAVFETSWALLTPAEQAAFRRLAVFQGDFTPEAAQQITGASRAAVEALVAKSLVQRAGERYTLHALTRQYAAERLQQGEDAPDAIHAAHADYYLPRLQQGAAMLRADKDNSYAAWTWAVARRDWARLDQALEGLAAASITLGLYAEGAAHFAAAIAALGTPASAAETRLLARLLARGAELLYRQSRLAEAQAQLLRALSLVQAEDPAEAAYCLHNLSYVAYLQARFEEAVTYAHDSLALSEPLGCHIHSAVAYNHLGMAYHRLGQLAPARESYARALALFREHEPGRGLALTLNNLANLLLESADWPAAEALYRESLALSEQLQYTHGRSLALNNLSYVLHRQGRNAEAEALAQEELALVQQMGDALSEAGSLDTLGMLALAQGDAARAEHYHTASLKLCRELEDPWGVATELNALGQLALLRQAFTAARAHFTEAATLALSIEAAPVALTALAGAAAALQGEGNARLALALLACVAQHPAATADLRAEAAERCAALRAVLPTQAERDSVLWTLPEAVRMLAM